MTLPIPQESPLLPTGQLTPAWRRFFQTITGSTGGTVSSVSVVPANGISGTVGSPSTTPAITLALGAITPTSVASPGSVTGSNLSGTNTGDQTITLTGDVTGTGTGSFAATVGKIGGKAVNLAGALTTAGAFASTFTMTGVTNVTFPTSGTLAAVSGTMAAGGSVVQATNKSTGVTLNTVTGQITTNNAALAANTVVTFTLTDSVIAATDIVLPQLVSGPATAGTYEVWTEAVAAGSVKVNVRNISAGALSEALVIGFAVIKSVTA